MEKVNENWSKCDKERRMQLGISIWQEVNWELVVGYNVDQFLEAFNGTRTFGVWIWFYTFW